AIDQWKGAYADDIYYWDASGIEVDVAGSVWFPSWANGYDPWAGDSGHPVFVVINGELVLVGCWHKPYSDHDPNRQAPNLGPSIYHNSNIWLGFAFDTTTNTIVAEAVWRWNTGPTFSNHALNFINGASGVLSTTTVTNGQSDHYSAAYLNAFSGYPFN